MKIKENPFFDNDKCIIIAEVGQNHEGSLGLAHAYIDAIADSGANAVKFQTHIADSESSIDEPFRVEFSKQDKSRIEYWRRMEFSKDNWRELKEHADSRNLLFLSSPFSVDAVNLLDQIDVPFWKIGSGDTYNIELIKEIIRTNKPVLLSTGLSNYEEIERAVNLLEKENVNYGIMQCTSKYPTPLSEVGINVISELRDRFKCPVGLSDHSGSIFPGLMALANGISFLEVHITFSKKMFGPDISSSLSFEDLKFLCQSRDSFYEISKNPVDKNTMFRELVGVKKIFGRSLALKQNLKKGSKLTRFDITTKKPGTGVSIMNIDDFVGKTLSKDVPANRLLLYSDIK